MSVRKAALGVSSGLLRALPQETSLAQLWVAAALPLVRDVEASLQEQLLDSFHEFIIAPAGVWQPQILGYSRKCVTRITRSSYAGIEGP